MVDAEDLKSFGSNTVWVRVPPWAPIFRAISFELLAVSECTSALPSSPEPILFAAKRRLLAWLLRRLRHIPSQDRSTVVGLRSFR